MLRNVSFFCLIFAVVRIHEDIGDPKKIPVIDDISDFLTSSWAILEPVVRDEFD